MSYRQIIAGYWLSPSGFIGLVYLIGNDRFDMNIDLYLYLKSAIMAVIPISLPLSLIAIYKNRQNKN